MRNTEAASGAREINRQRNRSVWYAYRVVGIRIGEEVCPAVARLARADGVLRAQDVRCLLRTGD